MGFWEAARRPRPRNYIVCEEADEVGFADGEIRCPEMPKGSMTEEEWLAYSDPATATTVLWKRIPSAGDLGYNL